MMPAISINALPALPPFQFLPEADLNFDAVLATVASPAPQPPVAPEVSEPSETLLNFLGINPVKGQLPIGDSPPVKDEVSDRANDESSVTPPVAEAVLTLSPLSPQINTAIQIPPPVGAPPLRLAIAETQSKSSLASSAGDEADASTATRSDPVRTDLAFLVTPETSNEVAASLTNASGVRSLATYAYPANLKLSASPETLNDTNSVSVTKVVPPNVEAPNIASGASLLTPTIAPRDLGSTLPRRLPIQAELGLSISAERVKEEVVSTSSASAFGLSLPKPSLSLTERGEGSISVGSVQTEAARAVTPEYFKDAASAIPLNADGVGETPLSQATPAPQIGSTQPVAPSADPLRFVVDRQLDLARDGRWLDALARDIVAVADAPDRLSFRLSPPQLGQLDVDLSSSDNGLSVRMNASTEAAAHIVAAAQPRLIDELKSQGVRVAEAHVSTGGGGQSQGQGQPQQQRDADQMIEFVRQRIERNNETNLTRPTGRFA